VKNICELTVNQEKRMEAIKLTEPIKKNFPKSVSQPALRALASAGFTCLDDLTKVSDEYLLKLHGMGPKAIEIIRVDLTKNGKSFS